MTPEKWTGWGLKLLQGLLKLDPRSKKQKHKSAESRANSLENHAGEMLENIVRAQSFGETKYFIRRLQRKRDRLLNRARFWKARAAGLK